MFVTRGKYNWLKSEFDRVSEFLVQEQRGNVRLQEQLRQLQEEHEAMLAQALEGQTYVSELEAENAKLIEEANQAAQAVAQAKKTAAASSNKLEDRVDEIDDITNFIGPLAGQIIALLEPVAAGFYSDQPYPWKDETE